MPDPLYGNFLIQARANSLAAYLNGPPGNFLLKLFSNSFLPTPATPLSSFIECAFPGYVAISLNGVFGAAVFVQNGQYEISSPIFSFGNTGASSATIAGWYITDLVNLLACQAFTTAITIAASSTYTFQLRPQEISQSIL